jgi:hypothetical protein
MRDRAVWDRELAHRTQQAEKRYLRSTTHFDKFNDASVLLGTAVCSQWNNEAEILRSLGSLDLASAKNH